MSYTVPPPVGPEYSAKIRAMKRKTDIFLEGACPKSIKSLAHRIGSAEGRKYQTRKESGGIRVWRIA